MLRHNLFFTESWDRTSEKDNWMLRQTFFFYWSWDITLSLIHLLNNYYMNSSHHQLLYTGQFPRSLVLRRIWWSWFLVIDKTVQLHIIQRRNGLTTKKLTKTWGRIFFFFGKRMKTMKKKFTKTWRLEIA